MYYLLVILFKKIYIMENGFLNFEQDWKISCFWLELYAIMLLGFDN